MFTYFMVMNDFGIKVLTTLFLNQRPGYFPLASDVYNPDMPNFGNSNFGNDEKSGVVQWGLTYQSGLDIRLFYHGLNRDSYGKCRWEPNDESVPRFYRISPQTGKQICYTPEALLYA
jgi:hypothetical protein